MRQEYTDKLKNYQDKNYELLLREKCVLDARQFLHASLLYLNYALITEKMYTDISKKTISESNQDPFYNRVEVLGWHYNAHTILNKLTLEWISHISNALDCILQYVNSALNLKLSHENVKIKKIYTKLQQYPSVSEAIHKLWDDENVNYIRSVYNYSKHTMDLYGGSSFEDIISGSKNIRIPDFKYKGNFYETKNISTLMEYYETFLGIYINLLDTVNSVLQEMEPVSQRYHIGEVVIDDHIMGDKQSNTDITIYAEFADDGEHIKKYWIEDSEIREAEIMSMHSKTIGQHMGGIPQIEVVEKGKVIGTLCTDIATIKNSTLQYLKYKYIEKV